MDEKFMFELTGRHFEFSNGIIYGFKKFSFKMAFYPAAIPFENASVEGKVYFNLDLDDFMKLDKYEGECYDRVKTFCQLNGGDRKVEAFVYVFKEEFYHLLVK